ncbi:hypothetical protein D3C73_1500630 [compost metagenome]
MHRNETAVTEKLLHHCYTCDHAHGCDSETKSVECWSAHKDGTTEHEEDETRRLLRLYAE